MIFNDENVYVGQFTFGTITLIIKLYCCFLIFCKSLPILPSNFPVYYIRDPKAPNLWAPFASLRKFDRRCYFVNVFLEVSSSLVESNTLFRANSSYPVDCCPNICTANCSDVWKGCPVNDSNDYSPDVVHLTRSNYRTCSCKWK